MVVNPFLLNLQNNGMQKVKIIFYKPKRVWVEGINSSSMTKHKKFLSFLPNTIRSFYSDINK
jgi:hypothetical protein